MKYEINDGDVTKFISEQKIKGLLKARHNKQLGEGASARFSKYSRDIIKHFADLVNHMQNLDNTSRGPRIQPRHVDMAFAVFAHQILDSIYEDDSNVADETD